MEVMASLERARLARLTRCPAANIQTGHRDFSGTGPFRVTRKLKVSVTRHASQVNRNELADVVRWSLHAIVVQVLRLFPSALLDGRWYFLRIPMSHSSTLAASRLSASFKWQWMLAGMLCLSVIGCGTETPVADGNAATADHDHADHDHEDHADHDHEGHGDHDHGSASFSDNLAALKKDYVAIKTAFEKDSPEDAHDALHEVGHVLEAMEQALAKESSEVPVDKAAAGPVLQTLFEAFGKLDGTMHGEEGVDIDATLAQLTTAMTQLKEMVK